LTKRSSKNWAEKGLDDPKGMSPAELKRYKDRKEREEAERQRKRASKRKNPPTVEEMVADLIRVATDEEKNPFHKTKTLSRQRYDLYGYFLVEEHIEKRFGHFTHALEIAGLRQKPATRMAKAAISAADRQQHAHEYFQRHMSSYVRKDEPELRTNALWLSISDTHSTFLDPGNWVGFRAAIRDLRPNGVLFNGDILEGAEISRHPKLVGWSIPFQMELDFQYEMFRQLREDDGYGGEIILNGGNHGIDRWAMYMSQVSPALAGLRSMKWDELIGLKDFDVQLGTGGTIISPEGTEDDRPGLLLYDFYRIYHGNLLGQTPALSELRAAGRSGQSGHVHRGMLIAGTTEKDEGLSWMCTPAGCNERAARAYIKKTTPGWQCGIGLARLFGDETVHQYPVFYNNGRMCVEGYTYEAMYDFKVDVSKNWLPELAGSVDKWVS